MATDKRKIVGRGEKEVVMSRAQAQWVIWCMQHTLNTSQGGNSNAERMSRKLVKAIEVEFPQVLSTLNGYYEAMGYGGTKGGAKLIPKTKKFTLSHMPPNAVSGRVGEKEE